MSDYLKCADFLFEMGMLAQTPRSFHQLLGTGKQSVAEHINRVCYVGFLLAHLDKAVNVEKVLKICLFHDVGEARVSDLHYLHQKYTTRNEVQAVQDAVRGLPFAEEVEKLFAAYVHKESKEALIAKDADNIELLLSVKEQLDAGNPKGKEWIEPIVKRLKTEVGKRVAEAILKTNAQDWWYENKQADWWVHRTQS